VVPFRAFEEGVVDVKELRELIDILSHSGFSTFEMERDGFKLRLVKSSAGAAPLATSGEAQVFAATATPHATPVPATPSGVSPEKSALVEVPSPIVGTYYRQPSPGAASFVEVGDTVKKGQVLCIIEAMKLMNEIEAEIDAEVVEICVQNGQPVEFGEVLFRLRPRS
jgi:acetyl-CoA carboxylase biotin carboxyl carrier protein